MSEPLETRALLTVTISEDPSIARYLTLDDGQPCDHVAHSFGDNFIANDKKVLHVDVKGQVSSSAGDPTPVYVVMKVTSASFGELQFRASPIGGLFHFPYHVADTTGLHNLDDAIPVDTQFSLSLQTFGVDTTSGTGYPFAVGNPKTVDGTKVECPPVAISVTGQSTIPEGQTKQGIATTTLFYSSSGSVTYSLSGADASYFTIQPNGRIDLTTPLDFEARATHKYSITVNAYDGLGHAGSDDYEIMVTDVVPSLQITNPLNNYTYFTPNRPAFTWNEVAIQTRTWKIQTAGSSTIVASSVGNSDTSPANFSGSLGAGSYYFTVTGQALTALGIEANPFTDVKYFTIEQPFGPRLKTKRWQEPKTCLGETAIPGERERVDLVGEESIDENRRYRLLCRRSD